jgi:hypothetical protein
MMAPFCIASFLILSASLLFVEGLEQADLRSPAGIKLLSRNQGQFQQATSCGPSNLTIETPACSVIGEKDGYELRKYAAGEVSHSWVC